MATSKSTGWSRGELPFAVIQRDLHHLGFARPYPTLGEVIETIAAPRVRTRRTEKPQGNAGKPSSPIIERAGSLMAEARPRRGKNGWLATAEYAAIGDKLDQHFKLGNVFRKGSAIRKELTTWNRKHPRIAIKTFRAALESGLKLPSGTRPRRAVQRWLSSAETEWRKHHANPAH